MSISKKFYSFFLALLAVFALVGCNMTGNGNQGGDDNSAVGVTLSDAQALVNKAMGKVGWDSTELEVVADLTFATSNAFAPGVVISWESSNEDVIALDGKVTRPVYGQGDATVTVTATFSLPYNLDDNGNTVDEVYSDTKTWTFTVKEAGEVFNIAKLEAQIVSGEVEKGASATITGVIVAKMGSTQGKQIFVHDGSAGIYVYTASDLAVGTEVQVSGTVDIYYEIFQIKDAGITVVTENATLPEAAKTTLGEHMAKGKDSGKIGGELINVDVVLECATEESTGHTNVFITDPKTGDKARIYYKTEYTYVHGYNNEEDYFAALQKYSGKTVNITLVQYDIKDGEGHRLMLTPYPITEVEAVELTDEEKAQYILNGLSLEDSYLVDFALPVAEGVVWSVKEGTGIEIVEGTAVVTRTTEEQTVVLTATATVNQVVLSKDFTVVLPLVEATVDGQLSLTVNSMNIPSSYASNTVTVSGVEVQYIEIGNYGAGMQMRNKEAESGNRTQLWNNTALSGAITKIEMVYNSTKTVHANSNCMIFSFGSEANSLTSMNFSTEAGEFTYTVTPNVSGATYFKIEVNPNHTYSMYWDSIVIYYGGEAGGETPEVPTHTHTICPTCQGCTAENCDGSIAACPGHEVETPTNTWAPVSSFEAGVAYKLGFYQSSKSQHLYLTGDMSGYYGATTEVAEEAADVYAVAVEGGYVLKVVKADGAESYIALVVSGTYNNFKFVAESEASVFTWDAEHTTFVTLKSTDSTKFFMGTYGSNVTFGMSDYTKYIASSYVSHFYALEENNDTPVDPEPTHQHVLCEECQGCTAEGCDGSVTACPGHEVETPTVITSISEALAADEGAQVELTGTVSGIYQAWNEQFGNISVYLDDENGNSILCFRLATYVEVGAVIRVTGVITLYNSSRQVAQGATAEIIQEAPEVVVPANSVTLVIADYADANSWTDATQYLTIKVDEYTTITATGTNNTGKYYVNGEEWRIYQTESPTITISSTKKIASVTINYNLKNTGVLTLNGSNISKGTLVEVNDNTISFGVGNTGTATNGQVKITSVVIVYAE